MPLALAIVEGRPPPVKELRPDIDPALADVIERAMSPDPLRRFGSADVMRRALNGEKVALVTPVPAIAHARSPRATSFSPLQTSPAVTAVSPASVKRSSRRPLEVAGSAALLVAMALAVLAFTSNPSSTTPTTAPGNFGVSTPAPSPIGLTEIPPSTAPTAPPSPVPVVVLVEAEQPSSPTRTAEKATPREFRDIGNSFIGGGPGNSGNENGYGTVNGGTDKGSVNGASSAGDKKTGNGNRGGNKGHANGNGGNGKPK
jgi:serine/threonine-protein kinase